MNSGSGLQCPLSLPLSSPFKTLDDVSNCECGESVKMHEKPRAFEFDTVFKLNIVFP